MEIIFETERLLLRKLTKDDLGELSKILKDKESMKYYPREFSTKEVKKWITWNIKNYEEYGHGLWAVILKEGNTFIGDCGITFQEIEGEKLPELGYRINKKYCNKGYATEASQGCIKYAFKKLGFNKIYLYTKEDNYASRKVAEKNGMKLEKKFKKLIMGEEVLEVLYSLKNIDI